MSLACATTGWPTCARSREHFGRPVHIRQTAFHVPPRHVRHAPDLPLAPETLDRGQQLAVIFRRLKPRPDEDVRREVLVYRRLLARRSAHPPAVYDSLCDEAQGRYWLFFEDVSESRLEWCDVNDWLEDPADRLGVCGLGVAGPQSCQGCSEKRYNTPTHKSTVTLQPPH